MRAFLGLGSNLGDREGHLVHAVRRLSSETGEAVLSSLYETEPMGFLEQDAFLNLVVGLETTRSPQALLELAVTIERERGRTRTFRNAPRTLDIDILLYGEARISLPGLEVPHPRMAERPFVLIPLLELEPALREPGTGRRYADLLPPDTGGVRRLYPGGELVENEE